MTNADTDGQPVPGSKQPGEPVGETGRPPAQGDGRSAGPWSRQHVRSWPQCRSPGARRLPRPGERGGAVRSRSPRPRPGGQVRSRSLVERAVARLPGTRSPRPRQPCRPAPMAWLRHRVLQAMAAAGTADHAGLSAAGRAGLERSNRKVTLKVGSQEKLLAIGEGAAGRARGARRTFRRAVGPCVLEFAGLLAGLPLMPK